jgi:hypothetical protein
VIDEKDLEQAERVFLPPDRSFDRFLRRRDRKRRNQRIAAGVVAIAVFVAAVWIVTSGLSLDRSQKSVAPAGEVTGPAETGPTETGPAETAPALASAAPDVWEPCRFEQPGQERARLELTDMGDWIRLRFEMRHSPPGDGWTIWIKRAEGPILGRLRMVFHGTRVASDSGEFVMQLSFRGHDPIFIVGARDWQTDRRCEASASLR